jgi:hypothetical protein
LAEEKIFGKNSMMSPLDESKKIKTTISAVDTVDFGKYYL